MPYFLLRSLLFRLNPELAHDLTHFGLALAPAWPLRWLYRDPVPGTARRVMGIDFPNAVGLAAGFDKDGTCIKAWDALGFGFIEVGTVTPRPQSGNPQPRMFRLPQASALINRMGFNNHGVDALVERLRHTQFKGVLGINIGKNADTSLAQAHQDYLMGMRKVYALASYIVVNISSPNTPGLRDLQHGAALEALLQLLKREQHILAEAQQRYVPLVIKISPDLSAEELRILALTLLKHEIDGVIATNTTFSRSGVEHFPQAQQSGGLSGAPLYTRSTEVVRQLADICDGRLPIIAAGGICSAEDAQAKLAAGASLVQLGSGLVYRGPALVREVIRALRLVP